MFEAGIELVFGVVAGLLLLTMAVFAVSFAWQILKVIIAKARIAPRSSASINDAKRYMGMKL